MVKNGKKKKERRIIIELLMYIILSSQEIWRKYHLKLCLVGKPKTVAPEIFITHNLLKKMIFHFL